MAIEKENNLSAQNKSSRLQRRLGFLAILGLLVIGSPPVAHGQDQPKKNVGQVAEDLPTGIDISRTPQSREEWRSVTIRDLEAIRDFITTQTPVPYDETNPSYRRWLSEGYNISLTRAEQANGPGAYSDTLATFVSGFGDPHFYISTHIRANPPTWPGFIVSLEGSTPVVTYRNQADISLPELGAIVKACDGEEISALIAKRVFPIRFDQRTALGQRRAVTSLFLDFSGLIQMPNTCDFQMGSAMISHRLKWESIPYPPDVFWSQFQDAGSGTPAQIGLSFPAEGVAWIGIPTFINSASTEAKLQALLAQISTAASNMRSGRAIVIDIRGNAGGSFGWADSFASAIFTRRVVRRTAPNGLATSTDWRVSAENIEFERGVEQTPRIRRVISELIDAKGRGAAILREGPQNTRETSGLTTKRPSLSQRRPFPARVFVLSDGTCISACLYFADLVLQIPGTRLIGTETGGDTGYTYVRYEVLPSRLAQLGFPMTYVHKRGRGPMEVYSADIVYDGPRNDESIRRWALELVLRETSATQ